MGRLIITLATALSAATLTSTAFAEVITAEPRKNSGNESDFQRAKASSADANKAFGDGDIETALAHAVAAYRAYPNASTAMQMATIYAHGDKHKKAFRWYLRASNHHPSEVLSGKIEDALKKHGAKARFGTVKVETKPKGATLNVEGDAAAKVKASVFFGLSFGSHTVVVTASDHNPAKVTVKVSDASIKTVNVELQPIETKKVEIEKPSIVVPLALVISGVVLAGAGAGVLVWGLGSDSDAETLKGQFVPGANPETRDAEFESAKSSGDTGRIAGFALIGVGAAVMITGAILWATLPSGTEGEGTAEVAARPTLWPGGGGVVIGGRF